MDQYTFIATMTGHLAWPVTTLLIAAIILFRLRWLAKFIKGVKYKDQEAGSNTAGTWLSRHATRCR